MIQVNKKFFAGALSLFMIAPTPVFATNPLESSQTNATQSAEERFKSEDNSNEARKEQPFDIQEEAYSLFGEAKQNFQNLQEQYGSLDEETNAGKGFQAYLKSIQADKENQALQNEINQIAQGYYTVNANTNTMSSLADAVGGVSDEEKAEELEQQEASQKEEEDSTLEIEDGNKTFAEAFGDESLASTDEYNAIKDQQKQQSLTDKESQSKEFGESLSKSEEKAQNNTSDTTSKQQANQQAIDKKNNEMKNDKNSSTAQNNSDIANSKQNNSAFGSAAANQNTTIQKNYNTLRKQIISAQKAISSAGNSASTSKSYQNKVKNIIKSVK